ncbi:MAG: hypothetical protein IKV94_00120 [Clostridia bacterium]|nr:hypothetical protein [Clostridia bacterium]
MSLFSLNWLIQIIVYIIFGVILYVISDKFGYFVNVAILAILRIVLLLLVSEGMPGSVIFLSIISNIIISFIIVLVAMWFRSGFDYDTIVYYILIVSVASILASLLVDGFMSIFI